MLRITDLTVNYGSISAVRELSLEVRSKEIVALVGANGAGKTTILLTTAGVVRPTKGDIEFEGKSILKKLPDQIVAGGVSLVPEGRRILTGLTVKENLYLGTIVRKDREKAQRDIEAMLNRFPVLTARYSELAGRLSGGEQQQLAFARALVSRPKLLLCDEPSLGLAPLTTNLVFQTLRDLHGEGLTILLVEQFAKRAIEMADRSYIIKSGAIALSGPREEMISNSDVHKAYFGIRQSH